MKITKSLRLFFAVGAIAGGVIGCSWIAESGKMILGTSTKALEEGRTEALSKIYRCSFDECYEAILTLERKATNVIKTPDQEKEEEAQEEESQKDSTPLMGKKSSAQDDGQFIVFLKDPIKGSIVVMGVFGHIETTEVGIFLSRYSPNSIKVEVSSESSGAKEQVATYVFNKLDQLFAEGK